MVGVFRGSATEEPFKKTALVNRRHYDEEMISIYSSLPSLKRITFEIAFGLFFLLPAMLTGSVFDNASVQRHCCTCHVAPVGLCAKTEVFT